jgi:subtilisin family serine protease
LPAAAVDSEVLDDVQKTGRARVLVYLHPTASSDWERLAGDSKQLRAAVSEAQRAVLGRLPPSGWTLVHALENVGGLALEADAPVIAALSQDPRVARIYRDERVQPQLAQGTALMGISAARAAGLTGAGITVAVIDTGVDLGHPDFAAIPRVDGWDFGDNDGSSADDCSCGGHGTAVAGIIASPNGVAPGAGLVALKIASCSDACMSSNGAISAAIDWCVTNQALHEIRVINISFGGGAFATTCDDRDPVGADVVRRALQRGIVIFAASGNDAHDNAIRHPACLSGVISVGAVYDADIGAGRFPPDCTDAATRADQITCYSNEAPFLDLLAPSHCARTTERRIGYSEAACFGGTSAASPYAAGAAALLLESNPSLTPVQMRSLLRITGTPIVDGRTGATRPRVNIAAALTGTPGAGTGPPDTIFLASTPARSGASTLRLQWRPLTPPVAYDVFRGQLTTPWQYSHDTLVACDLGPGQELLSSVPMPSGNAYFLVVPSTPSGRTAGVDSDGVPRPVPARCATSGCSRGTCTGTILADWLEVLDPAFGQAPCQPSAVAYALGDGSVHQYVRADLDVIQAGPGPTGEAVGASIELVWDGGRWWRALVLESCASVAVTVRVRVLEYEEAALGGLLASGSTTLDAVGGFDAALLDVSDAPVPVPYIASVRATTTGGTPWYSVPMIDAFRYDDALVAQYRSLLVWNNCDVPVGVAIRAQAVDPLLGAPLLLAPINGFPVTAGAVRGGPFDAGDPFVWFDAVPVVTSCADGLLIPWSEVTARDGASWYDTFWIDNSQNCWDMDFDAGVHHLAECCE